MDIGSILLFLSLLALVALFVARPFFEERGRQSGNNQKEDHELSSLLAERDRVINALQELDFDNVVGKIPGDIYPEQRNLLLKHGAEVLRKLDEYQGTVEETAEDRIEAAIAVQKSQLAPAFTGGAGAISSAYPGNGSAASQEAEDDIEVAIANRRRARSEKAGGFCPKCGKPVQAKDKFCPKCGTSL